VTVSVLLVEDVTELRSVLRQSLRLRGRFHVVAEADNGASAIDQAARHQPDVVVLDLGLPDLAGREVLTRLRAVSPAAQIVVYTGSFSPDQFPLGHQVAAYVTKDRDVAYLVDLLANLSRPRFDTAAVELAPHPREVAVARRFLAEQCRMWGCSDLVERAELVATELVTNAMVHAGTGCELRAGLTEAALRLQVTDQGGGTPDPRVAEPGAEHGRGLLLVSLLCAAWGVEALPRGGKVVWAELLRSDTDQGDDDHAVGARAGTPAVPAGSDGSPGV
jgi:CheY-like chemotaxis protein